MSEVVRFIAQNLRDSATEGPDHKGSYSPTAPDSIHEVVKRNYRIPQDASESLQSLFDLVNAENVTDNYEQRAHPGNKAARIAGKVAEIALPVAAGIAARSGVELIFGTVGGPPLAGIVGAITGTVSGAMEVRKVDQRGAGAQEFYQRKVSGRTREIEKALGEKKVLKAAWRVVSDFLSLPESIATRKSFKAKARNKEIRTDVKDLGIELFDKDLFADITQILQNQPEKTPQVQKLLQNLMTQATLTGFSESIDDDVIAKRRDALSVVTFAMAQEGKAEEVKIAFNRSRLEVARAVKKLKRNYVIGSAISRAAKSFLFVTALDNASEIAEHAKNAFESKDAHFSDLADNFNHQIDQWKGDAEEFFSKHVAPTHTGDSFSLSGVEINDYAKHQLIKAADSAGFGNNVDAYLAAGGQERLLRFDSIKQIYTELQANPHVLTQVTETAQSLGVSNDQLLEAIMTRAPYDLNGVTIGGVHGFGYESVSNWLDKVNTDANALNSLKQGIEASKGNLHSAWRGIWDGLLTNTPVPPIESIDIDQERLNLFNRGVGLIQGLNNLQTEAISQLKDLDKAVTIAKAINAGVQLSVAYVSAAEVWSTVNEGSVVFGDKYEGPANFRPQRAPERPRNNEEPDIPPAPPVPPIRPQRPAPEVNRPQEEEPVDGDWRVLNENEEGGGEEAPENLQLPDLILKEEDLPFEGAFLVPSLDRNGKQEKDAEGKPVFKTKYFYTVKKQEPTESFKIGSTIRNGEATVAKLAEKRMEHFTINFGDGVNVILDPRTIAELLYPRLGRNAQTEKIYKAIEAKKDQLSELANKEYPQGSDSNFRDDFINILKGIRNVADKRAEYVYYYLYNSYKAIKDQQEQAP